MLMNKITLADYQDWTKHVTNRLISIDFIRFGIVGASGFVVDIIILTIFYKLLHLPLLLSQVIAAESAIITNFTLHNLWTYKNSSDNKSWFKKLIIFHGSSWSGALLTTFILLILVNIMHKNYIFGLIMGSVVSMVWNYIWTKYIIFKNQLDN